VILIFFKWHICIIHSPPSIYYHSLKFPFHFNYCIDQLLESLHEKWGSVKKQPYPAMYSSVYGGIILDPAMMVIPMDDHMVHRGHGVFDTAIILDGYA
jgi:4-amino-4-deoxychorismate lyase